MIAPFVGCLLYTSKQKGGRKNGKAVTEFAKPAQSNAAENKFLKKRRYNSDDNKIKNIAGQGVCGGIRRALTRKTNFPQKIGNQVCRDIGKHACGHAQKDATQADAKFSFLERQDLRRGDGRGLHEHSKRNEKTQAVGDADHQEIQRGGEIRE